MTPPNVVVGNDGDASVITQQDLRLQIERARVVGLHAATRRCLTEAVMNAAPIEPGELIVAVEADQVRRWTWDAVRTVLGREGTRDLFGRLPETTRTVMYILNSDGRNPVWEKPFATTLPDRIDYINQAILREHVAQVPVCKRFSERQKELVRMIENDTQVEPGPLIPKMGLSVITDWYRDRVASVIGEDEAASLESELPLFTVHRLVVRDRDGRALGWHEGRPQRETSEVPLGCK